MHEPIRDHVELYLTRSEGTSLPAEFTSHLLSCAECRDEVAVMENQARIVRVLKPAREVEPAPGFYARVLEAIESQRPLSMWTVFLQPFGRRIAYASLALAVLMGVYLFSTEPGNSTIVLPGEDQPGVVLTANPQQDRDAVLVDLATYREQ